MNKYMNKLDYSRIDFITFECCHFGSATVHDGEQH